MESERCLILIGMMGAGKSTVGAKLAEELGWTFTDTDKELERMLCTPISRMFRTYGEDMFREHETALLKRLEPGRHVISTGGGIVLREQNWNEMVRLGTTVYLKMGQECLCDRLERGKRRRPLLAAHEDWRERLAEMLAFREPLYHKADYVIAVDGLSPDEVVTDVLRVVL